MNETKKKYILYGSIIILICCTVYVLWPMLGRTNVSDYGDTAERVRDSISAAQREQQTAIDAIGRIETGIRDSEILVGELKSRIDDAERTVETITENNRIINDKFTSIEERNRDCEELVRDSERRIETGLVILQRVREAAR